MNLMLLKEGSCQLAPAGMGLRPRWEQRQRRTASRNSCNAASVSVLPCAWLPPPRGLELAKGRGGRGAQLAGGLGLQ